MATHSSVLAWRIPGTGEPGGLPSMGSHRVGHDWSDSAAAAAAQEVLSSFSNLIFLYFFPYIPVQQSLHSFKNNFAALYNHLKHIISCFKWPFTGAWILQLVVFTDYFLPCWFIFFNEHAYKLSTPLCPFSLSIARY